MNKIILAAVVTLVIVAGGYYVFSILYAGQKESILVETNNVLIKNFAFNPQTITVTVGTNVTWVNEDSAPHTIKSDNFNSEYLNTEDSFKFTFNNAGTYDYICGIHPAMKGRVIVK